MFLLSLMSHARSEAYCQWHIWPNSSHVFIIIGKIKLYICNSQMFSEENAKCESIKIQILFQIEIFRDLK